MNEEPYKVVQAGGSFEVVEEGTIGWVMTGPEDRCKDFAFLMNHARGFRKTEEEANEIANSLASEWRAEVSEK